MRECYCKQGDDRVGEFLEQILMKFRHHLLQA